MPPWTWSESPIRIASTVLALVVGGTTATYQGVAFVDARYAKSADAQLTNLRLEEKILTDRVAAIQSRIWSLDDRYGVDLFEAPGPVKEEYRQMAADLMDTKTQIQSVITAYRTGGYPASDTYYHYEQPHR